MAVELAQAYVSIIPETSKIAPGVEKALGGVSKPAEKTGRGLGDKLAAGIGKTLKRGTLAVGAGAGAALGASLTKGIGRLNALDQANKKLEGLGRTSVEVESIMGSVQKSVKGTAFGLDEAANSAAIFSTIGVKSGNEMDRTMKLLADTTAQSGRGFDELTPIFAKIIANGGLTLGTFQELNNRATGVGEALSKHLGIPMDQVAEKAKDIDFETFATAMEENIGGAAQKTGETVKGAMDNMGAAAGRFGVALAEPAFKAAPAIFGGITDKIDDLTEKVGPAAEEISKKLGTSLSDFSKKIAPDVQAWATTIGDGFVAIKDGAKTAAPLVKKLGDGLGKIPFEAYAAGLAAFTAKQTGLTDKLSKGSGGFRDFARSVDSTHTSLRAHGVDIGYVGAAMDVLGKKHPFVERMTQAFNNASLPLRSAGSAAQETAWKVGGMEGVLRHAGGSIQTLGGYAAGAARGGISLLGSGIKGITNAFGGPWGIAIAAAGWGIGKLVEGHQQAAKEAQEHRQRQAELRDSLDETTGAITDQTRKLQLKALEESGAMDTARKLGLSQDTVADAMNGSADAIGRVEAASRRSTEEALKGTDYWKDYGKYFEDAGFSASYMADYLNGATDASDGLAEALKKAQDEVGRGTYDANLSGKNFIDFKNSIEDTTDSVGKFRTEVGGAWDELSEAQDVEFADRIANIGDEAQKASELVGLLGEKKMELGEEPGTVSVVMDETEYSEISGQLDELDIKSDYDGKTLTVEMDGGAAILETIDQIEGEVSFLPNGWIDVQSNAPEVNAELEQLGVLELDEEGNYTVKENVGKTLEGLVEMGILAHDEYSSSLYINSNVGQVQQGLSNLGVETTNLPEGKVHLLENTAEVRGHLDNLKIKYTTMPDGRIAITDTTAENIANLEAAGFKTTTLPGGFIAIDDTSQANIDRLNSLGVTTRELPDGTVVISDNADAVADHVSNALEDGKLDSSSDHQVNVTIDIVESVRRIFGGGSKDGKADGGRIPKSAAGRRIGDRRGYRLPVSGPGTDETDGILGTGSGGTPTSWVDAGEWVINGQSSEKYDPLLDAINRDDELAIADLAGNALGSRIGGSSITGGADLSLGLDIPDGDEFTVLRDQFTGLATSMQTASATQIAPALSGVASSVASTAAGFTSAVGAQIAPAMSRMGQSVVAAKTGLVDPAFAGVRAGLNLLAGQFGTSTTASESEFSGMGRTVKNVQAGTVDPAFAAIRGGLSTTESAFASGTAGMNRHFSTIRPGTADPARYAIGQVFNGGIVGMWNSAADYLGTSKMAPAPMNFATGGHVRGPGGPTDDRIPAMLSNGEFVVNAKATKDIGVRNLNAINAGAPISNRAYKSDLPRLMETDATWQKIAARYASGGPVKGSKAWKQIKRGYDWAQKLSGRPYVLGGDPVGGGGTDCSGYQSSIADRIGGGPGHRQWATMAFNSGGNSQQATGPQGFVKGLGAGHAIGVTNGGQAGGHTAGTIGGLEGLPAVNVESGGSPSLVKFGTGAVGADHSQFPTQYHLPLVNGEFVSGGSAGVSIAALIAEAQKPFRDKMNAALSAWGSRAGYANQLPPKTASSLGGAADKKMKALAKELDAVSGAAAGVDISGVSGGVQDQVRQVFAKHGWTGKQWEDAAWIIGRESSWNPTAVNPSSGAFGLFQFNPSSGTLQEYLPDRSPNPAKQANAGAQYIKNVYGNPTAARSFWEANGWYDRGGVADGVGFMAKATTKPERVLSPRQTKAFDRLVQILDRTGLDVWNGNAGRMAESLSVIAKEVGTAYRGGDWGYGELSRYIGDDRAKWAVNEAARLGDAAREITTAFREDEWSSSSVVDLLGGNVGFGNAVVAEAGAAGQASRGDISGAMTSSSIAMEEAAAGMRQIADTFNDGVEKWAAGDENRGRLGTPQEWAIHFGSMAAQEFAGDALGLLGLEDLANIKFSESFVNLFNAGADTSNDIWGTRFGHINQDSAQPLSLLDDEGRRPKPQESVDPAPVEPVDGPETGDEVTLAAVSPEAADDLSGDVVEDPVAPDDFMASPVAGVAAINAAAAEDEDLAAAEDDEVTIAGVTPDAVADLDAQSDLIAEPMADVSDLTTTATSEPVGQDVQITLTGDAFSAGQVEEMLGEVNARIDNTNIRVSKLEKKQRAKVTAGIAGFH